MTSIDFLQASDRRDIGFPSARASLISGQTVVCADCGCRLTTRDSADDAGFAGTRRWFHYAGRVGHDARGCAVGCADAAHDIS